MRRPNLTVYYEEKRSLRGRLPVPGNLPAQSQDMPAHIDEIAVQSIPWLVESDSLSQNVSVLQDDKLDNQLESTLGETLNNLPGMSSSFFGPGASRPIIRGQSGDRVRILIGGIGSIDASTVSPDHAVAGESLSIERIEIIRGPSTLLYGPNAIGGVVNILDGRIPTQMPEDEFKAAVRSQYGSNADERSIAASITAQAGDQLALHLDGSFREASDYRVPTRAHPEGDLRIENSQTKGLNGTAGLSWIGGRGFFGASISLVGSDYGVPGEGHHHEDEHDDHDDHDDDHEEEGEAIGIDLNQTRIDVMGGLDKEFLIFKQAKFRFGWADYDHTEREGDEMGTIFLNKGWEARLDLVQQDDGAWSGGMGMTIKHREFEALGDEAFTPPSTTRQWGLFIAEEVSLGAVHLQGGLRFDRTSIRSQEAQTKRFSQFSAAFGAIWSVSDIVDLNLNLSHTERAPSAEELFSNGAHLATLTYEQGNPDLGKETAWTAELGTRISTAAFELEAFAWYSRYDDYIYQADAGMIRDNLPVRIYAGADATFKGFEVSVRYNVTDQLSLRAQADAVRASLRTTEAALPRIPPLSVTFGIDYEADRWQMGAEVTTTDRQHRVTMAEAPTSGHTFVNGYIAWQPFADQADLTFRLRVKNLFNAAGFNHASFIKFDAPLPGRDIRFSVVGRF